MTGMMLPHSSIAPSYVAIPDPPAGAAGGEGLPGEEIGPSDEVPDNWAANKSEWSIPQRHARRFHCHCPYNRTCKL